MMSTIGDLVVRIGADTSELVRGVRESASRLDGLGEKARTGTTDFVKYGAAATAAGAALASALVASSIASTKELANLARVANSSVETFQKMAFGARTVGIDQGKLSDILKDTSDRVGDFLSTGGGPMADFFENIAPKIGVTAEQFRNLSGPQALQKYVDGLEQANLSQSEMTFYMEAMASDATALLPLLRDGGAAMAEQADQAARLGLVLSEVDSQQIEQVGENLDRVGEIFSGLVDQYTANLAPVLNALTKQFLGAAEEAGGVGEAADAAFEFTVNAAGFVMDAVDGIRRTFEVAGKSVALFGLGATEVMFSFAEAILNKPIEAVNELIAVLNGIGTINIEPVQLSTLGANVRSELETVRGAIAIAQEDIQATLMRPLPSVQFEQFVEDAKQAAEDAALIVGPADYLPNNTNSEDPVGGEEGGETAEDKKHREQLERRLARIIESNMTEQELLNAKYTQENEALDAALEQELITREEWAALAKEQKAKEEAELNEIEKNASEERSQQAEDEAERKKNALGGALSGLTTLMNSESKKMFEVGKAAALAQAVIDGQAAIVGAYKVGASIGGPVLGAAYGAAAGLATFQQIQSIRSQSFGGGGGGGSSGGAASPTQNINAGTEPVKTLNVSMQGFDPNSLYTGNQVGGLLDALSDEAGERGLKLLVSR